MRRVLDVYHYREEDIMILRDEAGYVKPTQENIVSLVSPATLAREADGLGGSMQLSAMRELVRGCEPGDHFVFHCERGPRHGPSGLP